MRIKRLVCMALIACIISLGITSINTIDARADEHITQTEVAKYALSWDGQTDMKYVYGGPGGRGGAQTLEECKAKGHGFDCSAFTSMVYRHFGIEIPAYSFSQKDVAYKVFTDEDEAVPGDICYWEVSSQHVGIYLGEGRMVHTNTSREPYNYPHISVISGEGKDYKTPEYFLRMVSDVNQLKPIKGTESDELNDTVASLEGYGYYVTESDLTGMPSKSMLIEEQKRLELVGRDNLSTEELQTLAYVNDSLEELNGGVVHWYGVVQSFLGLFCMLYGILLIMCMIFDMSNNFLEVSLLSVVTFGRLVYVAKDDVNSGVVKQGYDKASHVSYVTFTLLMIRVAILFIIGALLLSHSLSRFIIWLFWR